MDSPHIPAAVGVGGLLGTITLSDINNLVAISVGVVTLCYLVQISNFHFLTEPQKSIIKITTYF